MNKLSQYEFGRDWWYRAEAVPDRPIEQDFLYDFLNDVYMDNRVSIAQIRDSALLII